MGNIILTIYNTTDSPSGERKCYHCHPLLSRTNNTYNCPLFISNHQQVKLFILLTSGSYIAISTGAEGTLGAKQNGEIYIIASREMTGCLHALVEDALGGTILL